MELTFLPMTRKARDGLIAGAFLWILFAITMYYRVMGRVRGAGLGADDFLSMIALVRKSRDHNFDPLSNKNRSSLQVPLALVQLVRASRT
jgi:hypothetical protein